jgi:hypothetical protein
MDAEQEERMEEGKDHPNEKRRCGFPSQELAIWNITLLLNTLHPLRRHPDTYYREFKKNDFLEM